jgi:cellulose biosynthesis protein BcsQ
MDLSSLYELIERFHRTNQLPVFLLGIVVTLLFGFFAMRLMRLRIVSVTGSKSAVNRLERRIEALSSDKDHLNDKLNYAEKDADAARARIGELKSHLEAKTQTITELTTDCERLKDEMMVMGQGAQLLAERNSKLRRSAAKLSANLETIKVSNGRIWEIPVTGNASPFRSLSQRRTPILSLLNLKGGVGKTTIAANLAVAMFQQGWRVLVVDLDHQGTLSQLLLSDTEMKDLIGSRRLVHEALDDPSDGLAKFQKAIVRISRFPQAEIFLVAADEELGNVETAMSQRWIAQMTGDDIRYRLRAILHSETIAERFDFILLDCPPRLTTACINALGASDYVLVPVLPNSTSTAAVPRLLRWMKHLRQVACPELSVIGVVGNKAKFYGNAPVKMQQAELDSLEGYCKDTWGEALKFFPPLRTHDSVAQPLPALDPKLRGPYFDLVNQLNKELPSYARSRSSALLAGTNTPVGSVRS